MPCRRTVGRDVFLDAAHGDREYGGCSVTKALKFRSGKPVQPRRSESRSRTREPMSGTLALADQIGEGAEGFFDIGVGAGAVHLVEVDVVGTQPLQRVLDLTDDPTTGAATLVGGRRRSWA